MKTLSLINLFLIVALLGCNAPATDGNQNDAIIQESNSVEKIGEVNRDSGKILSADKASIGMTIDELKKAYPNAKFIEEPLYMYGIDSEKSGLLVVNNNEKLLFVWVSEDDHIKGITILSPSIVIDSNVSVGMNFQEFLKKYPDAQLAVSLVDEGVEYYHVKDKDYIIEFLTKPDNRVGEYKEEGVEAKSIRIVRPNAKIDRITIN